MRKSLIWATTAFVGTVLVGFALADSSLAERPNEEVAPQASVVSLTIGDRPSAGFQPAPIKVPDGFSVELAAGPPLVTHPTMACFDDSGQLYVCDSAGVNMSNW